VGRIYTTGVHSDCITPSYYSTGYMESKVQWMLDTKAGESLRKKLLSHPAFAEEPKMAIKAIEILVSIYEKIPNSKKDYDWGISYKKFENGFREAKKSHKEFVKALTELGLLPITQKSAPPTLVSTGKTRRYLFRKEFKDFYIKSCVESENSYDPEAPLRSAALSRKRNRRLGMAKKIEDVFKRTHEVLSCTVEVDRVRLRKEPESSKKNEAMVIIEQLRRSDFIVSESNIKSSRLFHTLANFPSDFRKYLKVKDKVYSAEVDIRACWSTFLEAQLLLKQPKNDALKAECAKWRELFCNPTKDPREAIIEEYGLNATVAELKEYLNKYLNGYTVTEEGDHRELKPIYSILDEWFADAYPAMYKAWKDAKPKKLASQIGVNFETPLMSDPRIYSLAKQQDVVLYYQFDGFGIFARPMSQSELEKILVSICELMQKISFEKFGVPIVVKQELFI